MIARLVLFGFVLCLGVDGSPFESDDMRAYAPATRVATVQATPTTEPAPVWPEAVGPCAEWAPLAFAVGWPVEQWPTISRVMFCESHCQPQAYNRSGASGLLQLMPMWTRGVDPFDPETNLRVALHVWHVQGWHAWSCYR